MAVRDDFAAGEVLAAADLNDTFASKLPYSYGTATPTATDDGFLWYDENDTPPTPKFWDGAAFQALTSGKILQIVRATDTTNRTTTSTSFVDASLSVTITPQKSDSTILLIATHVLNFFTSSSGGFSADAQITDNSNNAVSGAQEAGIGTNNINYSTELQLTIGQVLIGYSTPATTSATTYKLRFKSNSASVTARLFNSTHTGQLYAIEVSA